MSGVIRILACALSPLPRAPKAPLEPAADRSLPAVAVAPPLAAPAGLAGRTDADAPPRPACADAIGGCALSADSGPPDDATDRPAPGATWLCALSRLLELRPTRISLSRPATCLALP